MTGFFSIDSVARNTLETAALIYEPLLADSLEAIVPTGGETWTAEFDDPSTGFVTSLVDLNVPEDTLMVFVGARNLPAASLG
ncbi:MAG: hypothetical protein P8N76_04910 [Pirellulaceae bacterium]|nr:hypothetical protein [Pirellulaceae bacterium]